MSIYVFLTLVGFAWLLIGRVASYNLTMAPDHVRVSDALQTVTFTCSAGVALAGCQFTWRDGYGKEGPLLDFSREFLYQSFPVPLTSEFTGYSYSGRGLEAGDCGVALNVTGGKRWMVACRVRAGNGGWSYAWADLYAEDWGAFSHYQTPREAVVLQGGEARFALKAQEPLGACRFTPPGQYLDFDQGSESADSAGRYRYLGAGLQSGECGLAVSNVSEEDNGPVWCYIDTPGDKDEYRYMTLIVASRPSAPTLIVGYTEASVTATCEVKGARPVANISWILGDDVIRKDTLVDFLGDPLDAWRWPWMKGSVMQRLTLTLQTKDNGKVLKCVVSHVTLARPLEATETILYTGVASYSLTMTPDHVRASEALHTCTYTCSAGIALTGCQFTWWDGEGKEGPLLDLSRGSLSQANSTHLTSALTGYSYSGRGLGAGDCGVTLKVTGHKVWMVTCRVRAGNGGWSYAWADLYTEAWGTISHTLTPREAVVLQGGEARFELKAQGPLGYCVFFPPGKELYFYRGYESAHSAGRYRYLGAGLQSGECGLAVSNVSEEDNGPVRGYISVAGSKLESRFMTLIVASPPSAPTLSVVYTEASVTATCEVNGARPVANISWILGDKIIHLDLQEDSVGNPQDAWRWPWMKGSVMQRLTLTRQTKDNGKVLKCVVSHVTLVRPLEAMETILFTEAVSATTPLAVSSATPGAALPT